MNITEYDLNFLLVCTFRYSLGRMTAAPSMCCDLIRRNVGILKPQDIKLIIDEIDYAVERKRAGMRMDEAEWLSLRAFLLSRCEQQHHAEF